MCEVMNLKIVHIIDVKIETLIEIYFVDEETGDNLDYSVEEFLEDVKQ